MIKDKPFKESAYENNETYYQYYKLLSNMILNRFKWNGLPENIPEWFVEETLFYRGAAVFFKDEEMGFMCLPCNLSDIKNVYGIPERRTAFSSTGYTKELDSTNSVIIWNNSNFDTDLCELDMFCQRLSDKDRIIDVNCEAQKTPVVIVCSENQRLTMLNLYKKFAGNEPYIFGDKSLNLEGIKCIRTDAPYIADKMYDLKAKIWNEALTYFGISNISVSKKERLIQDEVTKLLGGTLAERLSPLNMRERACKEINKIFPELNVSVEWDSGESTEKGENETDTENFSESEGFDE